MRDIDELRPLTALRLLTIWRECGQAAEDPLERSLLSNARVLAECCYFQDAPVFSDGQEVLETLTAREMERILEQLSGGRQQMMSTVNPAFDQARFEALREG